MMVLAIRVGTVDYQEDSSALNLDHSFRRTRICEVEEGKSWGAKVETVGESSKRRKAVGSRYCTWLVSVRLEIKFSQGHTLLEHHHSTIIRETAHSSYRQN
jgi:hypothetical protein